MEPKGGNPYLHARLKGIQQLLLAAHAAGEQGSSSSKGADRELFVNIFLKNVLPPQFRFGSGDITDLAGKISGQLDLVVEFPIYPSLQIPGGESRLYLAEGVAAVIEVKSNLADQWTQVEKTSEKLAQLNRLFGDTTGSAPWRVPIFAVGYKGWSSIETAREYLAQKVVDGILIIENGIFVWDSRITQSLVLIEEAQGPWALWLFITALSRIVRTLTNTSTDPVLYSRADLVLLQTLFIRESEDQVQINAFDLTDRHRMERKYVLRLLESLREEGFILMEGESGVISLTTEGRALLSAPQFHSVPFR
ncbi:DUF6602 domain-containing protein [Archangium violaceum]|uniref:DUF6602 domain-containing protein n=1 Tax=Archangium violaceum TaxID=83451 RepID=UPI001269FE8F|nr:DUF6602 domain-containing protein [Archangium violaceum]